MPPQFKCCNMPACALLADLSAHRMQIHTPHLLHFIAKPCMTLGINLAFPPSRSPKIFPTMFFSISFSVIIFPQIEQLGITDPFFEAFCLTTVLHLAPVISGGREVDRPLDRVVRRSLPKLPPLLTPARRKTRVFSIVGTIPPRWWERPARPTCTCARTPAESFERDDHSDSLRGPAQGADALPPSVPGRPDRPP